MKKCKVFFFSHAGGVARTYLSWKRFFSQDILLCPIELPGRGMRIHEPFCENMQDVVADIYHRIAPDLSEMPYAFFGHSMGSILAYELMRQICENKVSEPMHIFFSGRFPPYVEDTQNFVRNLPDEDFIQKIVDHGGTSPELFLNKELMDIFLPVLRADYKIVETYRHLGKIQCMNIDISVLNGKQDSYVLGTDVHRWKECTTGQCHFYEFEGGHFYINQHKARLAQIIGQTLLLAL